MQKQSNQSEKELGSRQQQIIITKLPFKITSGGLNVRPMCPSEMTVDKSVHTDGELKRDLWLAEMQGQFANKKCQLMIACTQMAG